MFYRVHNSIRIAGKKKVCRYYKYIMRIGKLVDSCTPGYIGVKTMYLSFMLIIFSITAIN